LEQGADVDIIYARLVVIFRLLVLWRRVQRVQRVKRARLVFRSSAREVGFMC
jgi:hypothetical protein